MGEIETALARHPQVKQAVVMAKPGPGGADRLVAWVTAPPSDRASAARNE